MATSPLRESILSGLSKDIGVDKTTLYNKAARACGSLKYPTFRHMLYLLKECNQVMKKDGLFFLAPPGFVHKKKKYKSRDASGKEDDKEVLDWRDFAFGRYQAYKM
jgi:hypothetical protein